MTILLVRHGETEWNRARRYQGWSDSPLTARGIAQAEAIGHRLRDLPDAADAEIVASPIGRARRTAEIIAGVLERTAPPRLDDRLREISLGSWDGLGRKEIRALMGAAFVEFEWDFQTPHGETYAGFAGRIGSWPRRLAPRPATAAYPGVAPR